jgi:hypothetical protein
MGSLKDKVYINNSRSLQELEENTWHEMLAVLTEQLRGMCKNIFSRCETCIEAEGWHSKTLALRDISLALPRKIYNVQKRAIK